MALSPASCAQRNSLFVFLLGFLLCTIVGIANEIFDSTQPTYTQYSFLGAICLILLSIQFLYSDDADTLSAMDHALVLNSFTGFFFHIGYFFLLLSTTVLGCGLASATSSYFLLTSSAPETQSLVTIGFTGTLLSIFFLNSLHLKRLPASFTHKALFITTYVFQAIAVGGVVAGTVAMQYGFMDDLSEVELVWGTAVLAMLLVCMSFLDEIVELTVYATSDEAREARTEPFAFWCCVRAPPAAADEGQLEEAEESEKLNTLTPLLGKDAPSGDYQSTDDSLLSDGAV